MAILNIEIGVRAGHHDIAIFRPLDDDERRLATIALQSDKIRHGSTIAWDLPIPGDTERAFIDLDPSSTSSWRTYSTYSRMPRPITREPCTILGLTNCIGINNLQRATDVAEVIRDTFQAAGKEVDLGQNFVDLRLGQIFFR